MKLSNNAVMLPVGEQSIVNLVLTWDENNLTLIDAGYPGQTDAIIKAIADTGNKVEDLTHIIITHQDFDHVGTVTDLKKLSQT